MYAENVAMRSYRQKQLVDEMKAKFGIRLIGLDFELILSSTSAAQHHLVSQTDLVRYFARKRTKALHGDVEKVEDRDSAAGPGRFISVIDGVCHKIHVAH
jgi:hypothetical protein